MKAPDHKLGNLVKSPIAMRYLTPWAVAKAKPAWPWLVAFTRIKSARKAKNLTQEKLAEQINISTCYIAEIENKKTAQVLKSCVPYVKF